MFYYIAAIDSIATIKYYYYPDVLESLALACKASYLEIRI